MTVVLFVVLVGLTALGGGSPRGDVASLLYLRPASIVIVALVLSLRFDTIDQRLIRRPAILLGLLGATIVFQLMPLPPILWSALPGHALFLDAARIAGVHQPWRPVSIAPALTWSSLAALTLPAAALIAGGALGNRMERIVPGTIIIVATASAMLSLLQFLSIAESVTYLYDVNTVGIPSGIFANRNHHAAFLASTLPIIGVWAMAAEHRMRVVRLGIGACLILLFAIAIAVSGSRTGLALLVPGLVGTALVVQLAMPKSPWRRHRRKWRRAAPIAVTAAIMLAIMGILLLNNTAAIERLGAGAGANTLDMDQRIVLLPVVLGMVWTYFPFGSGFGTFDPAFRILEPDSALRLEYFNHAHNDLVELLATGGLAPLLVLTAALIILGRSGRRLARRSLDRFARATGAAALAAIVILLAASLTDYPLRTPLLAVVFAFLWLLMERTLIKPPASSLYPAEHVK